MRVRFNAKRFFKILIFSILGVFISANIFVLISGEFYLYNAVYSTYFQGQDGPDIYDSHLFYNRTVKKDTSAPWAVHPRANSIGLTEQQEKKLEGLETTSFLVIKDNFIIQENYWDKHNDSTVSNSFSMAKSIISLLVGIAEQEGKIDDLDDPVGHYLPSFKEGKKSEITLRHLLTMSAALDWDESGGNPLSNNAEAYYGWDLHRMIEDLKLEGVPGKVFEYKSGYTQILAFVLKKATGQNPADYASNKIWQKIGAENDALWSLDEKDGMEKAFCCFYATTRDFARIGRLILEKGYYKGKKVVPQHYIDSMLAPADELQCQDGKQNDFYGLQWWVYQHPQGPVYYARGILGQYIICMPEEDLIIVRTGHKRGNVKRNHGGKLADYKVHHPDDLFLYIDIARSIVEKF